MKAGPACPGASAALLCIVIVPVFMPNFVLITAICCSSARSRPSRSFSRPDICVQNIRTAATAMVVITFAYLLPLCARGGRLLRYVDLAIDYLVQFIYDFAVSIFLYLLAACDFDALVLSVDVKFDITVEDFKLI